MIAICARTGAASSNRLPIVPGIVVLRSFKMKELQEDRGQDGTLTRFDELHRNSAVVPPSVVAIAEDAAQSALLAELAASWRIAPR
jgi:hypothetical protein